jgi:hypothetical protein
MTDDHDRYREWSAAYVLGALEPGERAAFERHLDTCDRCQADVRTFAPLPGLLAQVDDADLPDAAVDDAAAARVKRMAVARADAERATLRRAVRRWRLAAAGAAAAAVMAVGGLVLPPDGTVGTDLAVTADVASGSVLVAERGWGTHVELDLAGLPERDHYVLLAIASDGSVQTAATWGATPRGTARVTGATAIALAELDRLLVTSDDPDDVLVTASAGAEDARP